MEAELEARPVWTKAEDNLFNADHRNLMIKHHGGTMASTYSVGEIQAEYEERISKEPTLGSTF